MKQKDKKKIYISKQFYTYNGYLFRVARDRRKRQCKYNVCNAITSGTNMRFHISCNEPIYLQVQGVDAR